MLHIIKDFFTLSLEIYFGTPVRVGSDKRCTVIRAYNPGIPTNFTSWICF